MGLRPKPPARASGDPFAPRRACRPAPCAACLSVAYAQYAPSSRLASRAPDRSRCDAGFHHGLLAAAVARSMTLRDVITSRIRRSPRPFRAAPRRSRTFANDACWTGSNRRWSENDANHRRSRSCSTANRSPRSSPCVWGRPRGALRTGRYGCWRAGSSSWGSSSRSATKPSGGRLKKRHDAAENRVLGDPATGRCRVRGEHGTGLGPVSETLRSGLSRRVHGRAAGAVGQGNPSADGGHEATSPACRLRVRTGRHGLGLPVQRTAGGLAAGDGPGPAQEGGLGAGGRRPVGRTLRRLREDHLGVRQPQHAHQGRLLRSVRADPGHGNWFVASSSATRRNTGVG